MTIITTNAFAAIEDNPAITENSITNQTNKFSDDATVKKLQKILRLVENLLGMVKIIP